jgi:nitroreductase
VSASPVNAEYEAIRTRRMTRQMSDEPVDPEVFALVLEAARYAPNAGNRRLQPVVPVTDAGMLRMLRMVSPGMIPRPQAVIVVRLDTVRAAGFGFRPGTPGLYIDVGTTASTLLLAAHALGLASCPVTSFSYAAVARLLDLGRGIAPQLVVCLGHAAPTQPDGLSPLV